MDLDQRYPSLSHLMGRAKRRLPHFVWEFLNSGTGAEVALRNNRDQLDAVRFMPMILQGEVKSDLSVEFLGRRYKAPFGIGPAGMSGLVWPDAEAILAQHAASAGIPHCLSTVAAATPERIGPMVGDQGWFQLYPPREREMRVDLLARVRDAGFHTVAVTLDVPTASRRERQTRGGMTQPARLTPQLMAQIARCPAWALGMARHGIPHMRTLEKYAGEIYQRGAMPATAHVGYLLRTAPDLDYLKALREEWDGTLIAKGVLDPASLPALEEAGVDALWVSNHGARQFDGAPSSIEMLPIIRAATALPIVFDSGIEGGLDILRAYALGADFVMLTRAWHYALGALGATGPAHLQRVLEKDLISNMGQIGAANLSEVAPRLINPAQSDDLSGSG